MFLGQPSYIISIFSLPFVPLIFVHMSKAVASSTYDTKRREEVLMDLRPLRKFKTPVQLLTTIRCAIEGNPSSYVSNLVILSPF